jgi:tetratricopeptide (TPR) repeat protein
MDDFGGIVGGLIGLCIGLPILAIYIYSIIWAYGDAEKRGKPGWLVALLVLFVTWPVGVIIWLLIRPGESTLQLNRLSGEFASHGLGDAPQDLTLNEKLEFLTRRIAIGEEYLRLGSEVQRQGVIGCLTVDAYNQRGLIYLNDLDEVEKAIQEFSKAIDLDKRYNIESNDRRYLVRQACYRKLGRYHNALSDINIMIGESNKPSAQLLLLRGQCHQEMKAYDEALNDFNQAISLYNQESLSTPLTIPSLRQKLELFRARSDIYELMDNNIAMQQDRQQIELMVSELKEMGA